MEKNRSSEAIGFTEMVFPELQLQWLQQHGYYPLHSISLVFFFLPLLMILFLSYYCVGSFSKKGKLPPSPPRIPIIGNLHQIGPLVHRSLRSLSQKHGPLMLLHMGQIPTLIVSSAEMAQEIMKTHDLSFANRPSLKTAELLMYGQKNVSFAPYGEYWRQMKKTCVVRLLNLKQVESFRSVRDEEAVRMIANIAGKCSSGSAIELGEILYSYANGTITRASSSSADYSRDDSRVVRELLDEGIALIGGFQVFDLFPSLSWLSKFTGMDEDLRKLFKKWDGFLNEIVDDHLSRREVKDGMVGGDFVDVLLSLHKNSSTAFDFSKDDIKAIIMDMIAAGTDTSYVFLEWAMAELIRNPKVMKKVSEEINEISRGKPMVIEDDINQMNYLKAVIKEVLRLHIPVPLLIPHESMRDIELQGYKIPTKTRVIINAWAIARDPDSWEDPEEFVPERFMNSSIDFRGNHFQFIPFGAGRRMCPGINFANSSMEVGLANLLYHFNWTVPDGKRGDELDMTEAPGLTTRRKHKLYLIATPRSP